MIINNLIEIFRLITLAILIILNLIIVSRFFIKPKLISNITKHAAFFTLSLGLSIWTVLILYGRLFSTKGSGNWYLDLVFYLLMIVTIGLGIYLLNLDYLKITSTLNKQIIKVTEDYVAAVENVEDVVISLARTIDAKDKYTEGHTERVSQYATFLAERLGLKDKTIEKIRIGALIHDIGKIGISLEILNKTEELTEAENAQIRLHPELGYQICSPLKAMEDIGDIIRYHHEKLDGSGYPDGLKGEEISLEIRIVTIADIFDALTTDRPYRRALDPDQAIKILKAEAHGGKLDIFLVNEFAEMLMDFGLLNQIKENV